MTFAQYLRSAVLGAALAFSCGPKEGFDDEDNRQETLEVRVQRDVTDNNGIAFNGAQEIILRDEGSPVANEEVTLYQVGTQGDVYLTQANGGGIALFPETRRRYGAGTGRELNVNVHQQIRESEEELLHGLLRWNMVDFSCSGRYGRDSVPETGSHRVVYFSRERDRYIVFSGSFRQVLEKSPHEVFYALDQGRPRIPLFLPDEIAREVFSESLYNRIREECRGGSASCSGEVLFEDGFEGEELDRGLWENRGDVRLNKRILEMEVCGNCSHSIQSRSTYSLSDGPLCFEARWRVREREGVGVHATLEDDGKAGGVGFFLTPDRGLFCGNDDIPNQCNNVGPSCSNSNTTKYHVTIFESHRQSISYYIDDVLQTTLNECIPLDAPLNVHLSCSSYDDKEKTCFFDYIKIVRAN